jgi:hypothetical protein
VTARDQQRQDEQIAALHAGKPVSLVDRLAAAEAELDGLAATAKEAYRQYRAASDASDAKAAEIKELRSRIGEEAARRPS